MPYWDRIEPMPTPGALDRTQYEDVERLAEEQRRAAPQDKSKRKRVRRRNQHHIPRPVNCFLAYRLDKQKQIGERYPNHTMNHRDISKLVAKWWHQEPQYIKDLYIEKAKQAKQEHSLKWVYNVHPLQQMLLSLTMLARYPGYKYTPKKRHSNKQAAAKEGDDSNKSTTTPAATESIANTATAAPCFPSSFLPPPSSFSFSVTSMQQLLPGSNSSSSYLPWITNPYYFFQPPYLNFWAATTPPPQLTPSNDSPASQVTETSFPEAGSSYSSLLWQPPNPNGTLSCNNDALILWQDDPPFQIYQPLPQAQVLGQEWLIGTVCDSSDALTTSMANNAPLVPELLVLE